MTECLHLSTKTPFPQNLTTKRRPENAPRQRHLNFQMREPRWLPSCGLTHLSKTPHNSTIKAAAGSYVLISNEMRESRNFPSSGTFTPMPVTTVSDGARLAVCMSACLLATSFRYLDICTKRSCYTLLSTTIHIFEILYTRIH